MKKLIVSTLIVFTLLFTCDLSAFAKPPSSSRSFSSSRSSSSSSFRSSAPSSAPVSKPSFSSSRPSTTNTVKPAVVPAKSSSNDASISKTAATKNQFTSKSQAESAFKSKYSSQYTSKYDKEPASRPKHVPQSTSVDGKNVNVTYNQSYGGYGYMHPTLGTWMMYDAMSDVVMMSMLMNNHGYHVAPAVHTSGSTVVYSQSGWGAFFGFIITLMVIVIMGIVLFNILKV